MKTVAIFAGRTPDELEDCINAGIREVAYKLFPVTFHYQQSMVAYDNDLVFWYTCLVELHPVPQPRMPEIPFVENNDNAR